ncbi:MAG: glucuronate isomerase [Bacteroidales bacterium]|nr:glucuronate isomerase [Bacteroidales bacterium]
MKKFMDNNFLLQTKTAQKLYFDYAEKMPIIDYHNHLPPKEIADNKNFENITQAWLYGDHYKWRAMRSNGVEEKYCTGDASDFEKFEKWAETVPHTMRNPLYHWTHLELKRYFGISELLNPDTAKEIYKKASEKLSSSEYSVWNLLKMMNIDILCTTDDPVDSLEFHKKIKEDGFEIKVLPAWRPDKAMAVDNIEVYNKYLDKLSEVSEITISEITDLLSALKKRHEFFHENGCRVSDHGIETFYAGDYTEKEIQQIFKTARSGKSLNKSEIEKFKTFMLVEFAKMNHLKGWVQQFHYGAIRNNNSRMFNKLGPDTGFDSIGDFEAAKPMAKFFDSLDKTNQLTKTIIYNINPRDNELIATMIGNFNDGSVAGKMQFGSGWWFLDQKDGIEKQLNSLSNLGLLSRFVGMLTDSRSFLSFPRHEYFRRVLCNLIGNDVENGELPKDMKWLGQMVQNICYNNAKHFFNL